MTPSYEPPHFGSFFKFFLIFLWYFPAEMMVAFYFLMLWRSGLHAFYTLIRLIWTYKMLYHLIWISIDTLCATLWFNPQKKIIPKLWLHHMNLLILVVFLNFFNISMIFPCRDDGSFLFSNALTFRATLILHFNTPNMDV